MKNEPILLNQSTMYDYTDMTLYLGDITILHNLCVDVLNDHPNMVGIQNIKDKLKMVIDDAVSSKQNDPSF